MSRIETIQLEWFSVDEKLPKQFDYICFTTNNGITGHGHVKEFDIVVDEYDYYEYKLKDEIKEWRYPF